MMVKVVRGIFVVLLVASVVVAGLALFDADTLLKTKSKVLGESPASNVPESDKAGDTRPDAGPEQIADVADQPPLAEDDASSSPGPMKNPLTQGVAESLGAMGDVLGDRASNEQDELARTLVEADDILSEVKQTNRNAMRQAMRQMRRPGARSPNILLIIVDDLRPHDLGCYAGATATPTIDRMAASGCRFDSCYAGDSRRTTHHSLQTGNWDYKKSNRRERTVATLPKMLWQANYTTAVVGDCSLAIRHGNETHGFDYWFGHVDANTTPAAYAESIETLGKTMRVIGNADGRQGILSQDLFVADIQTYLRRQNSRRPFFLQCGLSLSLDVAPNRVEAVRRTDERIAKIMETADQQGLSRNTVFVVIGGGLSADHADDDFQPEDTDRVLSESAIRTPLVVFRPASPEHRVIDWPCGSADLLPTFGELTSAIQRPRCEGQSLVAAINGKSNEKLEKRTLYLRGSRNPDTIAVRWTKWKAIMVDGKLVELFDLEMDPAESMNVAAHHRAVVEAFEKYHADVLAADESVTSI